MLPAVSVAVTVKLLVPSFARVERGAVGDRTDAGLDAGIVGAREVGRGGGADLEARALGGRAT